MRQVKSKFLVQVVAVLSLVLVLGVMFEITDAKKMFLAITKEWLDNSGMPSYAYMNNIDTKQKKGLMAHILSDVYPMNEYLLANEIYVEENIKQDIQSDVINITASDYSDDVISENQTKKPGIKNESESQGLNDNGGQSPDVAAAISRNTISGKVYDKAQLSDYNYMKNMYIVTGITSLTKEIFRPGEFIEKDLSIKKDETKPQILIFHTHSQETFVDSVANDPATSIVGVGEYLTELLTQKYGYNVIHDKSVYDLVDGKLDRSKAYTYAQEGITKILEQNPSIEVVIDLHRDGVAENMHLVTEVDGKKMSKIMFFNGISYTNVNGNISYLNNPYRDDNLAMSMQMYLMGEAYYPGFLRNNYINAYRYCLHNRGRSMLVEAGAQTNTFSEVKNAMEPLADMLDKVLSGQKAY